MMEKGIKRSESMLSFAKGLISDASTCGRYMFGYAPPPIVENDPEDAIKVGQQVAALGVVYYLAGVH